MTKAPACKVCGSAHWSNEPHKFPAVEQMRELVLSAGKHERAAGAKDAEKTIAALRVEMESYKVDALAWRARKAANAERMKTRRKR